ncbi:late expression factor 7 [Anticarsia gemmatalis nucleopolyhedrovirus]|uniref:Late expression factor 7 n=2 Tax=Alphabaculovirus TaxID=558016 RepID=A0A0S3IZG3_9ABAC|nr:late expression factor 7 [Anticarsia gemmatalis nucleopolyhedrovirus]ABI13906.1 late expression factor 7 [Anticarsia gemmatalis multiple nucleopolyhedrovirus]AAS83209.1 late expression factor 7 [Anticarsia gemmatalis nucleopolyhedrovirus]ALR69843.1 late expression factor 7 [Anticarsia gemmatalis multiple nucleopolyhedrovirus]ALR70628.1 late expression factor 7 [Anticarsia gemmatalis multiple nucleopolyhedrovirus]ALR70785.1 late expression factor 7 [Anticarsia gemmatalis multiple nucleopolyh
MELPSKRCRLCRQLLPALPRLPIELIDAILRLLPFDQYMDVVGASAVARRRALRRRDWSLYYFKYAPPHYDPAADKMFVKYWGFENDDPARLHVAALCRYAADVDAQNYFNKQIPRNAASSMLNAPRTASDSVLAHRWNWWRLARALLTHEKAHGRGRQPARVRVFGEAWISEATTITDKSVNEFNAQPDAIANVLFDKNNITVYTCGDFVFRLI